jgi:urocanate hydratase
MNNQDVYNAMQIKLDRELPPMPDFMPGIRRAPSRGFNLTRSQTETA